MSINPKASFFKGRIPDKASVAISVEDAAGATAGSFVASARLLLDDGGEEIWDDSMIHPGPKTKTLAAPDTYVWRVRVGFTNATAQTATIKCVVTSKGKVFGETYEHPVSGKNGEETRATIFLATEK